ncbi:MAG: hypothetical protein JJE29_05790 [Peptostreptococcaceae bacterium]|nr:hypothetical protein [Peptostreptococcaceae bacterium]
MAVKKLCMMNIVCKNEHLDELLRDLILEESCQFTDSLTEIEESDFSIGMTEENADEILDIEDIVVLKENNEVGEYISKMDALLKGLNHRPKIANEYMLGEHNFELLKEKVDDLHCKFVNLTEETKRVTGKIEYLNSLGYLEKVKNIDIDFSKLVNLNFFTVKFGFITQEKRKKIAQNYEHIFAIVLHLGAYEEKELYIIVSPKTLDVEMGRILRSTDFMELEIDKTYLSVPMEMERRIEEDKKKFNEELKVLRATALDYMNKYDLEIDRLYSKLLMAERINGIKTNIAATQNFSYLSAWVPEGNEEKYNKVFSNYDGTIVTFKASEEVTNKIVIPTFLKNSFFFKPFETLVTMYGVPSHDEIDPTSFFGLVYILLFGAMFGDLGQGIVIVLAGLWMVKKGKEIYGSILWRIGLGTILFGIIYDSFFGYENIISKFIPLPIYLRPISNINTILLLSVVAGLVLLTISYVYSILNKVRRREMAEGVFGRNGVNGLMLFLLLVLVAYGMATGNPKIPTWLAVVLIMSSVTLMVLKQPLSKIIMKVRPIYDEPPAEYYVEGGFNILETFLGMLSNSISFIRLGAFALNHVGLFIAFRTMAEMMGSRFGNVLMFILGNLVILSLEGLVVFIQGLRLFYYELFSKYYEGEGVLFAPVKI